MSDPADTSSPARYRVFYCYDNPSPAGPFKGSMTMPHPYKRGEMISGIFGRATVTSCKRIKPG